jgi:hypothetical protein
MGVAAMKQDCNYQLDIMKLGRKKGESTKKSIIICSKPGKNTSRIHDINNIKVH